ncbi:unnamed protein product [Ranitomeya imitator]|uniref:Beta-1,4-glucuronyltransferase 1 n=1 Tax=Ranitomeya imitator TaxID=111125 RepID=A0ABN9MCQ2_9NEOB|nr:unnamed protein product [Ranitomeya imitator]
MPTAVRCSFFCVILVTLLLVVLPQLLYLSLLSNLHGQQQHSAHPVLEGTPRVELRWQREQKDHMKSMLGSGGILDASRQYRIYRHLLARDAGQSKDVALASHASLSNLWHLQELVQRCDGRISLALFASSGAQVKLAMVLTYTLTQLCQSVRQRVSVHLVCQSGDTAVFPEQDDAAEFAHLQTSNTSYPNNLLRNATRGGIGSAAFVLVLDIDTVPSQGLRSGFLDLADKGVDPHLVFVVPALEIRHTRRLPGTKEELLRLYQVGEV